MGSEKCSSKNRVCKVCGSAQLLDFSNHLSLPLVRCAECGLVFNWSRADNSDEFLGEHSAYYSRHEAVRRLMFGAELSRLSKWCSGGRLLDFGGGAGHLSVAAIEQGFDAYVVEPNSVGRTVATTQNGLKHVYEDIDKIPEDVFFDVVILNHVIEHVENPVFELERIRKRMKPEGFLLTTQPNLRFYGTLLHGLLRRMHLLDVQILSEGHVLAWQQRSLTTALRRAGFMQIESIRPLFGRTLYRRMPACVAQILSQLAYFVGVRPSFALIARGGGEYFQKDKRWPTKELVKQYYEELYQPDFQVEVEETVKQFSHTRISTCTEPIYLSLLTEGHRVLDLGCGVGGKFTSLKSHFSEVYGTEISLNALIAAKKRYPYAKVCCCDVLNQSFPDEFFDLVFCSEVIEHLYPEDSVQFFMEVARIIKPGGHVIITTPNGRELRRLILWLPIQILSIILRKPQGRIAASLYNIQGKIFGTYTAKAKLFKKYGFLEHLNIVSERKIVKQAKAYYLIKDESVYETIRPLFVQFNRLHFFRNLLLKINKYVVVGRFLLCSDMAIRLRKL